MCSTLHIFWVVILARKWPKNVTNIDEKGLSKKIFIFAPENTNEQNPLNIVSILPPGGLSQYDSKWWCWLYQIQWHPRGGWHHVVLSHRGALCNHNYLVVSSWIVVVIIFPLFITNTNHINERSEYLKCHV